MKASFQTPRRRDAEQGFVLLVVLFVLLALFALTAPFLATARNADAASHFDKDGAQLRLALDGASRHARYSLEGTHPALDLTPYFDSEDELEVKIDFPEGTKGVNDVNGVAWDVEADDLAGRIDLNSAPPQVIANLLGAVARLSEPSAGGDATLKVSNAAIFSPEEVVVIEGELIKLGEADEKLNRSGALKVGQRGVGAVQNKDGQWETTGPLPPKTHGVGAYVFDQRALAPVTWRTLTVDGRPAMLDSVEEIRASEDFSMSGGFTDPDLRVLRRTTTPFGNIAAGPEWQRPTRLTAPLEGGTTFALRVTQGRWLVPGATVRIQNGISSELRVVMARGDDGTVILDRAVDFDYEAFVTEISVLAKRPVNVNTASPEVLTALFANLKLTQENHRITEAEAAALAAMVVESRPLVSFEDFVKRIVLPAGGIDVLPKDAPRLPSALESGDRVLDDARDAVALLYNSLNANDARLEFATMPISFTSRNVFELELRANISAKSGVQRAAGVRERIELLVPQKGELLQVFARQEDFDDQLRLTRAAPYWLTGPNPTGRYDSGVYPPSRGIPYMGTLQGSSYVPGINEPVLDSNENLIQAQRVFASLNEESYVQLDPIRLLVNGRTNGRVLHFDLESRSLEGRFLPDEPILRDPTDGMVRWVADQRSAVVQPLSLSMWIKPQGGAVGTLMSMGSRGPDSDRIVLGMDGTNLVLQVYDGMGDHRDTAFREVAEVKMPLGGAQGAAGIPTDIWSHVDIDVRGNRPDQMSMIVNGNANGVQVQGMTRLVGGLGSGTSTIQVESTDGFPARCTLRIGTEIIEATVAGPNAFLVQHNTSGAEAGYGGRLARIPFDVEGSPTAVPSATAAATISGSYDPGTPVMHYGYSLPITKDIPPGGGQLGGALGPFRLGRVEAASNDNTLQPIFIAAGLGTLQLGRGWVEDQIGTLPLSLGDAPTQDPTGTLVMQGFSSTGGYAALFGRSGVTVDGNPTLISPSGAPIHGVEVIQYSGIAGNALQVVRRGVQLQRFANLQGSAIIGGARQWVFEWNPGFVDASGNLLQNRLDWQTFCMPISVAVPGASSFSFVEPVPPRSEFAQITRLDDPEQTEWIRYDEIDTSAGQLVRSDPVALTNVYNLLYYSANENIVTPGGGGGGGGSGGLPGGSSGGGSGGAPGGVSGGGPPSGAGRMAASAAVGASVPVAAPAATLAAGADWDPIRGTDPNNLYPLSRAVASVFHFRGVLGTSNGDHPAGATVLPVVPIRIAGGDFEQGRPGAKDPVFIVNGDLGALGFPVTMHRAHYPAENRQLYSWSTSPGIGLTSAVGADQAVPVLENEYDFRNVVYVAFESIINLPTSPGSNGSGPPNVTDPRFLGRIVKFPSGELPRVGGQVSIGVGASGAVDFGPSTAQVDEVVFGNSTVFAGAGGTAPLAHAAGGALILSGPVGASDLVLPVLSNSVRLADRTLTVPGTAVGMLPADGGIVRIGEELIAYQQIQGAIAVAVNGRGLMGTLPQAHAAGEAVHWLEGWEVTTLVAAIGPDDAALPVSSIQDFGTNGTVLIDDELIHYTRVFGGALVMPRSSGEPGAMDELGPGVFRGRFGTTPASHSSGAAIISFPARYWDRYAPRYDGPDLAFFGLSVNQPGAFWNGVIWDAQEGQTGGAEIVVLQRTDPNVPWDADPEDTEGLTLMEQGDLEGGLIPIGGQSDRAEWRVFARYAAGAFDPAFGASHGWKDTPRFIQLGVTYSAPPRVYRSIDR
ncbi:hypothetical protein Poly30_19770 [Planctomycetes bacterium Poly30]|uniref:Uncharacterized protein n=1 Tax=Saltatorellus ferox TaxID=2528018 RepID=A0A518EQU9_9BACT|nr:hypothetical protein Poly30_19770 [Planctomycetes bacterium Poly30]